MKTFFHKLLTAILAVLMVAGALCAISGAAPRPSSTALTLGEGSAPLPELPPSGGTNGEATSPASNF